MKRIGFITRNKVLAQGLAAAVSGKPGLGLELEPFLLLDPSQALLDAEVLRLDAIVVDVTDGAPKETETALSLCEKLRGAVPECRLLLLVPQDDRAGRDMAISAVRSKLADDFVFYDTSLEYLFAKLAAF